MTIPCRIPETMTEQLASDLYRLKIPLPGSPLKSLNSYLVTSADRCLVVDTGMNRPQCEQAMRSQLAALGVDPARADYFITHLHVDHFGLVGKLAGRESRIYLNSADSRIIRAGFEGDYWERYYDMFRSGGFPAGLLAEVSSVHPARLFRANADREYTPVCDGDIVRAGEYSFTCIETPGHTPGHTCLYEKDKKILISGDHILFDISPNITFWPGFDDALARYLAGLDRVYEFEVSMVLPGHRSLQRSHRERIEELKEHHRQRLDEITGLLADGPQNAFQIAPRVSWDSHRGRWEQFPPQQKFFATGETIAHLDYLLTRGQVKRETAEGIFIYSST